ncbi:hypothetical protein JCM5350_006781 [Sporobolomyces pararoseus]
MSAPSTSTSQQVRDSLEASYKSTRLQLSRILAFKAHLQQHGAAQYGRTPQTMVVALKGEMDKFDQICEELEKRVMRAIATLERDAKKTSTTLPLSTSSAPIESILPSVEPASSAVPTSITSASQPSGPETITLDDEPDLVPSVAQPMQLDLTLSPTPPPPHPSIPQPPPDPAPFALPTSTNESSSSSGLNNASSSSSTTTTNPPPLPTTTSEAAPATSDDLNALLSSLNMPPFDPNAFLQQTGGGGGGVSTGMDADALAALLGTGTGMTTSAPQDTPSMTNVTTSTAGGGSEINLTGFDFSSISGLNTTATTSNPSASIPAPTSSALNSTTSAAAPNLGMDFDFSSLGGGNGGLAGLDGMDFSNFGGSGNGFDLTVLAGGTGEQMSEANLEELLKSLGG